MSNLPITPLSPEEQQRLMAQMYVLLGKQVKSYHRCRHMGENSSVPVELAQELMASMEYTIELAGGLAAVRDAEAALKIGQGLLEAKVEKAQSLLELVTATVPTWQTDCRWEALQYLRRYLGAYDPLHIAHCGPDALFYPIPIPVPDSLRGVDLALFYLNVLWLENQIMAAFSDEVLEMLWNKLPTDILNQCEQVILNALGKISLSASIDNLTFTEVERSYLQEILSNYPIRERVMAAAGTLCQYLDLTKHASGYLDAAIVQIVPRIETAIRYDHLSVVFL